MEPSYWHQRWTENRIGFHLAEVNAHIENYWPKLALSENAKVFVPLCGKSHDLIYLRDLGSQVVGIELNESAVQAFFAENKISVSQSAVPESDLRLWQGGGIEIYVGDFFQLTKEMLSDCQAVYDRASIVALPPEMRLDYVNHMQAILPAEIKMLLISMEYDESKKQGPPFPVSEAQIKIYYQDSYQISLLATHEIPAPQKSESSQAVVIIDKVFLLES